MYHIHMRINKRVGAVIYKANKVLLVHRFKNEGEYWVLPGGGVEEGESLDQALQREVREETGLDLIESELLGVSNDGAHEHYFYNCKLSEGEPQIGGPEKEDSSSNNIYILEWVLSNGVENLNLYPASVKEFLK